MFWPQTRHVERQAVRLHDMMERLGVDGAQFARLNAGQSYADARKGCLECRQAARCLTWLEQPDPQPARPQFCPNLEIFDRLAAR
jgi:hypothetical protein